MPMWASSVWIAMKNLITNGDKMEIVKCKNCGRDKIVGAERMMLNYHYCPQNKSQLGKYFPQKAEGTGLAKKFIENLRQKSL